MLEHMFDDEGRPTPELLRELLKYDPDTGKLFWLPRGVHLFTDGLQSAAHACKRWNARNAGKAALTTATRHGYYYGSVFNTHCRAHRVIWAIVHGEWPQDQIDHINGNPSDNRILNLRSVTHRENHKNRGLSTRNTSGRLGVRWEASRSKWQARIGVEGREKFLGSFDSFEEASAARKAAEVKYGFHKNHGRG
jgi:hypothetical protein